MREGSGELCASVAKLKSGYASLTAHAQCKTKIAAYLDAAIASALKKAGKDENFRLNAEQRANRLLVSSVGRAPVCCVEGWGFEPQTGPTLRVLK